MIVAVRDCDAAAAWDILRQLSQQYKVTVRIVARNDGTGHRQASIALHRSMTRTGRRCARYVSIATTADGRCPSRRWDTARRLFSRRQD
jgi:hypothetical protein